MVERAIDSNSRNPWNVSRYVCKGGKSSVIPNIWLNHPKPLKEKRYEFKERVRDFLKCVKKIDEFFITLTVKWVNCELKVCFNFEENNQILVFNY